MDSWHLHFLRFSADVAVLDAVALFAVCANAVDAFAVDFVIVAYFDDAAAAFAVVVSVVDGAFVDDYFDLVDCASVQLDTDHSDTVDVVPHFAVLVVELVV